MINDFPGSLTVDFIVASCTYLLALVLISVDAVNLVGKESIEFENEPVIRKENTCDTRLSTS